MEWASFAYETSPFHSSSGRLCSTGLIKETLENKTIEETYCIHLSTGPAWNNGSSPPDEPSLSRASKKLKRVMAGKLSDAWAWLGMRSYESPLLESSRCCHIPGTVKVRPEDLSRCSTQSSSGGLEPLFHAGPVGRVDNHLGKTTPVHPTKIRTSISLFSAVELNTTSALANYATEANPNIKQLIRESVSAREMAYAPYSKFKVGAALLCEDGEVVTGCNVENISYGASICAERAALVKAVSCGQIKFRAIAVTADASDGFVPPCGVCRQFIVEFSANMAVYLAKPDFSTVLVSSINSDIQQLVRDSVAARNLAYCPYSKFQVGAALITTDGETFTGCNVENIAYGGSICAERTAIVKAVSSGKQKFKAIAVATDNIKTDSFTSPCGPCRQFIVEFGSDTIVYLAKTELLHSTSAPKTTDDHDVSCVGLTTASQRNSLLRI
uniref:cytidine deaminase n=1 Tax=Timema californicum TaxID=61474 RepID=A0A7R9J427_TIMCA|nr:unnamed protein product [Timema californicum]